MLNFACALAKKSCLLPLLALVMLCACSTSGTSQPSHQAATPEAQTAFMSYVGKWEVHDSQLTINVNHTGLEQWNVGPCSGSMCNGNAEITFIENADGSIKGTIHTISYSQWNGSPTPTGFRPDIADLRAGDAFQLQHNGAHLLYTTWSGKLSYLNNNNRYWCDSYALNAGWKQCGA